MKTGSKTSNDGKKTARTWIEATFQKRECVKFIPSPKDEHRCWCGLSYVQHCAAGALLPGAQSTGAQSTGAQALGAQSEAWQATRHTRPGPTDAYGTIEFQGGPHPTKAQYVRLAYDTRPELIVQLLTREWGLELPKLLITVQGGKANFELQPKLKKVLRKGLLKAAKTTGAWIFTGGTNTGVTRQVGDALLLERSQRAGRVVSIGIAPWGIVENNHELLGHNRDVPYHSISSPRSKFAVLNNRHAYFLLVDNGTGGRYGAEILLRRKLEKFISAQKLHLNTHSSTPVVCLVIEGGTHTVRAVLEYVTDTPPVPVVVCDGSGRAADLIAFVHKYAAESGEQTVLESMKGYLLTTIMKTFEVGPQQAECLYHELLQCTRRKNLITVFRIQDRAEGGAPELDQTILTALFRSQHLTPSEQLSLALTWNRVDIARSEIFVYGQEWPPGALDEAMMQALEHDRIDFVKLLLENGVSMRKFLTIPRLEELYNTRQGPTNTLGHILRDLRPHIPCGYCYTLHDVGLVINKLMGGAYRAYYTRRKFRPIYAKVMNKNANVHRNSASFVRHCSGNPLSLITGFMPVTTEMALFDYPFNELLMWAVLTKRHQMALLMWTHGEEALAKALAACKLYKAMAHEAAEDDLETEIYEELRNCGKEFETKALELLDFCYRQDDDQAQQLLTCELQNWSGQTCLSLAVAANHRALLAHPCSQIILADLWMGGLRTRKNTNLKVILGLLCPFYIVKLEFKSKEELQLMPQTEEEHLENESLEEGNEGDKNHNPDAEALIGTEYETRVQENGKVGLDLQTPPALDYYEVKQNRPLRLKKKLYEFFTAPITKFWADSLAYMFFLMMFTYTVLVQMERTPSWQELYSIAYITTLGCEKIREIVCSEPVAISHKFSVWAWNMWNPCDAAIIIFFLVGLSLRLRPSTQDIGRVIYCVDSIYWYLRILNILGVNKYLGPLVTMMGKMVKNMIYFVVLLLVVLMSFGVCRQAILFPNSKASWRLIREVFYQPYFMLYGEVFADDIDPPCDTDPGLEPCETGRWITPIAMSTYLLVANILLINLLIAVFNNIFQEVNAISHQVWMFQRFTVVMAYEQKPVLPPPLIILSHAYLLLKWLKRKARGVRETYDNGLKLFLEKDDMERLYDFEEECVEGYFREQEFKLNQSTEERVRNTSEKVENMIQKIEDINQKENFQITSIQGVEFRIRKLEELSDQIMNHLAVIHRFMATHPHMGGRGGSTDTLSVEPPPLKTHDRLRRFSERSEVASDGEGGPPINVPRRRITRAYTEARPDTIYFDDMAPIHFNVPVKEEDEDDLNSCLAPPKLDIHINIESQRPESTSESSEGHVGRGIVGQTVTELDVGAVDQPEIALLLPHSNDSKETDEHPDDQKRESADLESLPEIVSLRGDGCSRTVLRRRNNTRRSSEGGSDLGGGIFLGPSSHYPPRRQHSQTHSEPDNSTDATSVHDYIAAKAVPSSSRGPRQLLLAMHAEYTSITDELETVCGLLSPPRTPRCSLSSNRPGESPGRRRHASEMSHPEFALFIEMENLRDAEENDYQLMENLIQRRYDDEEGSGSGAAEEEGGVTMRRTTGSISTHLLSVTDSREYRGPQGRCLRRASAFEVREPTSPLKSNASRACADILLPVPSPSPPQAVRQSSGETNVSSEASICKLESERRPSLPPALPRPPLPLHDSRENQQPPPAQPPNSETMC
ncbi:transient receptor potential cation channel, subfamily M isoform X2 [Arctopsyche grandis]|uniref:transient receptor potential cation channel, subfamily M isoform X2 n=1 Tax=Arctopsyche grandis TaxID=121162 RepID=UPI00406D7DAD